MKYVKYVGICYNHKPPLLLLNMQLFIAVQSKQLFIPNFSLSNYLLTGFSQLVHSFIHPFIHNSFIHPSINLSFILHHPFIHSFILSLNPNLFHLISFNPNSFIPVPYYPFSPFI